MKSFHTSGKFVKKRILYVFTQKPASETVDGMHEVFFTKLGNSRICIHQYGRGPRLLIAFHGFRETGENLALLEDSLGNDFTLYAPDMPFGGLTEWNTGYFGPDDLEQLTLKLAVHFGAARFSLLGYSMGGRMALSLVPVFTAQIDDLVLLAPDGLTVNFWYAFATRTRVGRLLFKYVTHHPGLFHFLFKYAFRLHLVNESVYKFVILHTLHERERTLVYRIWTCFRDIRPDIPLVARQIREKKLPAILFLGRHDRIFPPESGDRLRDIPSLRIQIVETGHQLLNKAVAERIYRHLAKSNSGL